jgi:hypothetical protein
LRRRRRAAEVAGAAGTGGKEHAGLEVASDGASRNGRVGSASLFRLLDCGAYDSEYSVRANLEVSMVAGQWKQYLQKHSDAFPGGGMFPVAFFAATRTAHERLERSVTNLY